MCAADLSRGALLGLGTEILVGAVLLTLWLGYRRALPLVLGGALAGLGMAVAGVPKLRLRALSLLAGTGDTSSNFRVRVWQAVGRMIGDRPWLGIGPGNKAFNAVYPLYQATRYSALGTYSVPLEIAVEGGLFGVLAFGWLLGAALRQGWQRWAAAIARRGGGMVGRGRSLRCRRHHGPRFGGYDVVPTARTTAVVVDDRPGGDR
ncbi:MAG: hypothetical protein HC918_05475 [Oscillatoriales cyanobacterium SM2_1_8]|nr:hypothetical protein [Oscillatoriales cyanobacterium SM2_1_8]